MHTIGSTLLLLLLAACMHHVAHRFKLPYTVLLFALGLLIGIGNSLLPPDIQINIQLTPDLLFFVFLPVLIFESGYNMKYYALKKDYLTIWSLATVGVLISALVIAGGGYILLGLLDIQIPFLLLLLFGVVISATDPVAILAIAKEMGLPKRLRLLLEGESLFNDGTALALFLILLELIRTGFSRSSGLTGVLTFVGMIFGGMILGIVIGVGFSYLIRAVKNNEHTEIALTMILAHATFFIAERISHQQIGGITIHISGIIATAYAALILGNFGKTKISPKVEHYMEKFWGFFAFVCNSLVFLLMGMMIETIGRPSLTTWIIVGIIAVVVVIARRCSVFLTVTPLNALLKEPLPFNRQILLSRGGLKGALAMVLAILIPEDLTFVGRTLDTSPKELLTILIITSILVSLLLQGLSIKHIIKSMNIDKLYDLEEFEQFESQILVYHEIVKKLGSMKHNYTISEKSFEFLLLKYEDKIAEARLHLQLFLKQQREPEQLLKKALTLHALGIEKWYLKELFRYNEIPENLYHYQLTKIELQASRVKSNLDQIRGFNKPLIQRAHRGDPILWLMSKLQHTDHCSHDEFILNRTRMVLSEKVMDGMKQMKAIDFGYEDLYSDDIINRYEQFYHHAVTQLQLLEQEDESIAICVESALLNKGLAKTEEHVIDDLLKKEIITEKLHSLFMDEVDSEVWKTY